MRLICITPFGLAAQNSASDLARSMCTGGVAVEDIATRRQGRKSGKHIMALIFSHQGWRRCGNVVIYYQLSDPLSIIMVYVLQIITGAQLVVHVLDNFIESKKYKKYFGFPRAAAIYMMRRADQLLTISPAMKDEFGITYGLASRIAFRWQAVSMRNTVRPSNGKLIFGGAINDKTNLEALTQFALRLAQCSDGRHLDVYARGGNRELRLLPNVTLKPAVDEATFIDIAADYEAFLVPFNNDVESLSFYRDSCPSKASVLFATQIPILISGPEDFWFLKFLSSYEFATSSLDRLKNCRRVPASEYVHANEALGSLNEVHSLDALKEVFR